MKETILKNTEAVLVGTLAVFAPIKAMIIVSALAVLVDFIVGIMAARKRGESIKSSKMGVTVSKLFIIETAIVMSFLVQTYLLQDAFPLTNWVASIVGVKEIFSIMESLNVISDNKFFTDILTKLGSVNASSDIKARLEKKKDEVMLPEEKK
jgi:hypothetical protein